MFINEILNKKISVLLLSLLLLSCGGGGGGGIPEPAPEIKEGSITGIVTLGPIKDGTVTAYDFSTGSKGATITTASNITDVTGTYVLSVTSKNKPMLLCLTGGSYDEPASEPTTTTDGVIVSKINVKFLNNEKLCAVTNYKTGQAQTISITYFTHLAYSLALNRISKNIGAASAVTQANQEISDWLGVDIIKTLPADITNPSSITAQFDASSKYGFANAGISMLMKIKSNNKNFDNINSKLFLQQTFIDVQADGFLNGRNKNDSTGQLTVGTLLLTKTVYRDDYASSVLNMANSSQNASNVSIGNGELNNFVDLIKAYNGPIFNNPAVANTPPVAKADSSKVNVNSNIIINVLKNDTDVDKDILFTVLNDDPATVAKLGKITLNADKTITYRPFATTIVGNTDSFSYFAYDGLVNSDTPATVTINVVAEPNTAPVALDDNAVAILNIEKFIPVLANDSDIDQNELTVKIVSPPGNASTIVKPAIGGVNFTGAVVGQETFTYVANDGLDDSNIATVIVDVSSPVNTAPKANPDSANARLGSTIGVPISVLANDKDLETQNSLQIFSFTQPKAGTVSKSLDNKQLIYNPPAFSGVATESFTYIATDGLINSQETNVTVNLLANLVIKKIGTGSGQVTTTTLPGIDCGVKCTADFKPAINISLKTMPATDSFFVSWSGSGCSNAFTITRSMSCTANFTLITYPLTLNFSGTGTGTIAYSNSGNIIGTCKTALCVINFNQGTLVNLQAIATTGNSFTGWVGAGCSGGTVTMNTARTCTATFTISNTSPIAKADFGSTTIGVSDGGNALFMDVLANDTDAETPNGLTISSVSKPSLGTTVIKSSSIDPINNNRIYYVPPASGTANLDKFTYTVTDGILSSVASVTITLSQSPGYIGFYKNSGAGSSFSTVHNLEVSRVRGIQGNVSINYTTVPGTAIAGVDYIAASGTLTFLNNDSTIQIIPIQVTKTGATAKTFTVELSTPTGGALLEPVRATFKIDIF